MLYVIINTEEKIVRARGQIGENFLLVKIPDYDVL